MVCSFRDRINLKDQALALIEFDTVDPRPDYQIQLKTCAF